jgi:endonuclease-8
MPEGDTLDGVARRLAPLVGRVPRIEAPQPRHAPLRIPERLAGRAVAAVEARGKHLLVRFEGGLVLHSHLRMSGRWEVGPPGRATRRPRSRAWLVLATDDVEALLFNGPVLELLTPAQARLHPALGRLGPDVLDDGFDVAAAVARARGGAPERTVADVLLDQRVLAGVGNVWKSEALFDRGLDPWARVGDLDDAALADLLDRAAAMMRAHVASGAARRPVRVYGRARRPCPICGTPIRARAQGDEGRRTFWCPACQPPATPAAGSRRSG